MSRYVAMCPTCEEPQEVIDYGIYKCGKCNKKMIIRMLETPPSAEFKIKNRINNK